MISFLAKTFIKDYQNTDDENVRHAYGNLTSLVGIVNNIVLFIFKFMAEHLQEVFPLLQMQLTIFRMREVPSFL